MMNKNNLTLLEDYKYVLEMNKTRKNTVDSYCGDIKAFLTYLGEKDVTTISVKDANEWLLSIKGKNGNEIKQATRNRKIQAIKSFYNWMREIGYVKLNVLASLKVLPVKDTEKKAFLETHEVKKLCKVLNQNALNPEAPLKCRKENAKMLALRDRALYHLMFYSGMRVGEVINLELDEIKVDDNGYATIFVPETKNKTGVDKYIPVDSTIVEYINEYRKNLLYSPNNNYVFLSQNYKQMTRGDIWSKLNYYVQKAGIDKHITNHSSRHTFATLMVSSGEVDSIELAAILGHKDTKMLQKTYFHSNNENTKKKFAKVM